MKPTLLILAAGVGSRYGGLKQIDPVGPSGETIIDFSVYDAIRASFGKLVFVIRHDIEDAFKEVIGSKFAGKIPVEYVYQELNAVPEGFRVPETRKKPWGTGHAILMAADTIREPFGVINCDDFYGATSFRKLAQGLAEVNDADGRAEYCMVGFILRNTLSEHGSVSRGVCETDGQSYLRNVVERTQIEKYESGARFKDASGLMMPLTGDETVSMNMWGFTPSLFGHLREQFVDFLRNHGNEEKSELFLPSVVNDLIDSHQARAKVLRSPDSWFGVTYQEDKPFVAAGIRRLIAEGKYPKNLWGQ